MKSYCPWSHKAIHWLNDHDVDHEVIDVIEDEDAHAEMIQLSGHDLVPVIDVGGEILADFGPEELNRFWRNLETKHAS